jgi:hypothetical protein
MNQQIKINIKALNRAFVYPIQGKTEKVECVCIPTSEFYHGKNGELYLTLSVHERQTPGTYGDTHFIKQQLEKESYNRLTEEQRKEIPIIGNMKPSQFGQKIETVTPEIVTPATDILTSDLPF